MKLFPFLKTTINRIVGTRFCPVAI